jgi:hypothetical protein
LVVQLVRIGGLAEESQAGFGAAGVAAGAAAAGAAGAAPGAVV